MDYLQRSGIYAIFHYIPLHDSHMGKKYGRISGELQYTQELSERLVRLPLWLGMEDDLAWVIQKIIDAIG